MKRFFLMAFTLLALGPITSPICNAMEHALFSKEWRIDRIDKKIARLEEERVECLKEAAKKAGSDQGYKLLAASCFKDVSPEMQELEYKRDTLARELGYKSYADMHRSEFNRNLREWAQKRLQELQNK